MCSHLATAHTCRCTNTDTQLRRTETHRHTCKPQRHTTGHPQTPHAVRRRSITFRFDFATTETIRRVVSTASRPCITQYDDHTPLTNSFVALEDSGGSLRLCAAGELAALFTAQPPLPLAIVTGRNARQIGQAFLTAGVPHVIVCALPPPASSPLCAYFLQTLYPLLLASEHTVQSAFDAAIAVVLEEAAGADVSVFALLPSGESHAVVAFPTLPKGTPAEPLALGSTVRALGIDALPLSLVCAGSGMFVLCDV